MGSPSKKKVKVVRIIARLNVGGPAVHCEILSRLLADANFETVLVTGQPEAGEESFEALFSPDTSKYRVIRLPMMRRSVAGIGDLRSLYSLIRILREERPSVVHTHTAKAGTLGRLAAFLCGVPVVIHTYHGHVLSGYFPRWLSWLVLQVEKLLAIKTTVLITLSPRLKRDLSQLFRVAPEEKFQVVPLGRNLTEFLETPRRVGKIRAEFGVREDEWLVGIIGRLVPIKNHRLLFEAFAQNPALKGKLLVVGDGPLRQELEALASDLKVRDRICFTGWRSDLSDIYSDLDLFILSSLNEGTPLSIIEAFAAGCPVLSTSVGGVPDMFTNPVVHVDGFSLCDEGVLVASGDLKSFAAALEYLVWTSDALTKRGICARVSSLQYSEENLASRVAALYKEELRAASGEHLLSEVSEVSIGAPFMGNP